MISIRGETPEDYQEIQRINDLAFEAPAEGNVINLIRKSGDEILSLLAEVDGKCVGHIFFSPITIDHEGGRLMGMGLAPLAVLPEFQNQGIGSMLSKEGLKRIEQLGCPFVIVLGHENYYPRFGFENASRYGLQCQWDDVPDDAFMVKVFKPQALKGVSGIARYRDEFDAAM